MNRFVRSPAYVRMRLFVGTLSAVFGVAIVVRTATTVGFGLQALVPLIAGAAFIGLGVVRWREYAAMRGARK